MGKLLSYSHNHEDVLIQRALAGVECGRYIDVGAHGPEFASNTWALYQQGWRGIVVDPLIGLLPEVFEEWVVKRPHDQIIRAAAGAEAGQVRFYTCLTATQMSSGSRRTVDEWVKLGAAMINEDVETFVPVVTLDRLLELYPCQNVHVLSLDVEGMEGDVLAGLDLGVHRPWLMVIERTSGIEWEPHLLGHDYETVFDDGSSRFYLARERSELKKWFCFPPHTLEYDSAYEIQLEERIRELEAALASSRAA